MRYLRLNKVNLLGLSLSNRTGQVWICSVLASIQSHGICHNDIAFTGPGNAETLSLFSKAAAEGWIWVGSR